MIAIDPLIYIIALAVEYAVTMSLNFARHDPGYILTEPER
jgi:hypothetical protein